MGINMRTWISQNRKVVYAIAAVVIVLVLIVVIWARQNRIPDFEDIGSFDPFRYELTYTKQEFKLKPHDRHWMLRRHTTYDANGNIEYQKNFELDSNNAAYYLHGDTPCYISRLPSEGFSNVTEGYPNWNIKEQRLDEYGRVIHQWFVKPKSEYSSEIFDYYYRTDDVALRGDDALGTRVRTMWITVPEGEKTWMYEKDRVPIYESTCYEIDTMDLFGNITMVWVEGKSYLATDSDGYLQMVIRASGEDRLVIRMDEYGRPSWRTLYSGKDGSIVNYSVWEYEEIEEVSS